MDEPHPHPLRNKARLRIAHPDQKLIKALGLRIVARNCVIHQSAQGLAIIPRCKILECAHADMALGNAGENRAGADIFAQDILARGDSGQSAGGGYPKGRHRLAQDIFAQDGPKPCAPIAHARKGCAPCAFELDVKAPLIRYHLAQEDCTPIP